MVFMQTLLALCVLFSAATDECDDPKTGQKVVQQEKLSVQLLDYGDASRIAEFHPQNSVHLWKKIEGAWIYFKPNDGSTVSHATAITSAQTEAKRFGGDLIPHPRFWAFFGVP